MGTRKTTVTDETFVQAGDREVRISSGPKIMFPDHGWTKMDLVEHYLMCLEGALRGVYNRPVLLKRFNKGVGEQPVFVKRAIKGARQMVDVKFPSARPGQMFLPLDEGDVVWMAQQNCVDLNPWNARADDLEHPDELRLDLDPTEGYGFDACRSVAATVHDVLDSVALIGWPKTSGNRGIHIYVRLRQEWDYFQVRRAGLAIAREVERRNNLATTAWWKEEREGVFIDFNQNAWDKTIASAYSVRHTGYVSTPFRWDELENIHTDQFDLMTFKKRWAEVGDITNGIDESRGDLEPVLAMVTADEERGLGEAPWPPHYPKMPGEPPRVRPSAKNQDNWQDDVQN
ncbi:MAG: ATP-dependent DNA ligase [Acidimicrobiia bacterium]|nr:ATP-dependent DNA ligase [Acidimicrobiia bacterium]